MSHYHDLIQLGFSTKEARVYLALLSLGTAPATTIAHKAGINRTTSYDILDALVADKLVQSVDTEAVQQFRAEPPEAVVSFLQQKIKRTQQKLAEARKLVPQLHKSYEIAKKTNTRTFKSSEATVVIENNSAVVRIKENGKTKKYVLKES